MRRPRRIKPKAFIICNGIETEYNYFSGLRSYLGREGNYLMDVKIIKGDPINVLEQILEGKFTLKHFDDEIDEIFVVFDVDDFYTQNAEALISIINKAITAGINVIFSNPCFELWLLLHFRTDPGPKHRNQIYDLLKTFLPDYSKDLDFSSFSDGVPKAVERARLLNEAAEEVNELYRNPSTGVYKLTELIRGNESP